MSSNKETNKTNSKSDITLYLDSNVLNEIKNDAHMQTLSINAKINSILTKYVTFYKHAEVNSCLFLPRIIHLLMVETIDEERLTNTLKKRNLDEIPTLLALNNILPTIENLNEKCFKKLFLWSGMYNRFKYYIDEQNYSCLLFEHKYNIKWSRIIGSVFSDLLENLLKIHTENLQVFPSAVLIRFKK